MQNNIFIQHLCPPINKKIVEDLTIFWGDIFGNDLGPDIEKKVFLGSENDFNQTTVYLYSDKNYIKSTCATVVSKDIFSLGGLAEVATHENERGNGFARLLCKTALEKFQENNGEVLFLGTGNPIAEKLYLKLKWQKINNSNVMVNIKKDIKFEQFLDGFFEENSPISIVESDPSARIPIIPIIIYPHQSEILDCNAKIFSTKYRNQSSCMGLYNKYNKLKTGNKGNWFIAKTKSSKIIGIASSKKIDDITYRIDGFIHPNFNQKLLALIDKSIKWSIKKKAKIIKANVLKSDFRKQSIIEKLGFYKSKSNIKNNSICYILE